MTGGVEYHLEIRMALRNVLETVDAVAGQPWDVPHSKPFLLKLPALADVFDADSLFEERAQQELWTHG